jgi:UDP-GlcNAc3NAcA epimerase
MKLATIVGARPQFIKAAVVSAAIRAAGGLEEVLIHTGQHYDENMSRVFFEELEIPAPDFHLNVGSLSHGAQTGRMLEAVEKVLLSLKPQWVLVYGDTNTTLAGALAAAKLHIPVAHVEAGLRSHNRRMPEEINRVVADHLADALFVPTDLALANLRREGIPGSRMHQVGDVMYDAALRYGARGEQKSRVLERLGLARAGYILATVHRAENTDDPTRLQAVLGGLAEIARQMPVVLPLHPRTRAILARSGPLDSAPPGLAIIEPLGYLDMLVLEKNARLIATDSGGMQKEAFFYHVPCVTLRDETEWVELVELGWNHLVPPQSAAAVAEGIRRGLALCGTEAQPYGDGGAAGRIAAILQSAPGRPEPAA